MRMGPCTLAGLIFAFSRSARGACSGASRSILTFNTDLKPSTHGYDLRRTRIPRAIAEHAHGGDFMCLQEVWSETDLREITKCVESNFPYHYSALHSSVGVLSTSSGRRNSRLFPGVGTTPCDWRLIPFFMCYVVKGCSISGDVKACMISECKEFTLNMSRECLSCVALTSWSFSDVVTFCVNIFKEDNRVNRPGLFIASRIPLKSAEYVVFTPGKKVLTERGYIKTQTQDGHLLICTQLSGQVDSTYSEVDLPFRSYEEQQRKEIQTLISAFSKQAHVLLGDLNTGPERAGTGENALQGEMVASYNFLLQSMGYQNPYLKYDGRCTYCADNPLVAADNRTRSGNKITNHLLTRDVGFDVISVQRILETYAGVPLSQHYGLQLDVCIA